MKYKIQSKAGHKIVNLNRRKAIRERCLNCSGWVPREVANCDLWDCSLYPFRPGKGQQNPKLRKKAIRDYCRWCMNGKRSEVVKCVCPDCPLFPYRINGIDNTAEIESYLKKDHIEPVSEIKNHGEYYLTDLVKNKEYLRLNR